MDRSTREAVIIDPVLETAERDAKLLDELNAKLLYILDTHVHADHITGAALLKSKTNAKTGVSEGAQVECADLNLKDGEILKFGSHQIKALATPGHTDSCMSYLIGQRVFTGDALLIRGCGRTDFQQGSSAKLYKSVTTKLFTLPPETEVFPAHDYRGLTHSTIALEIKHNPRLGGGKTEEEFIKTMNDLKLSQPKKIHEAVPANLKCGNVKSECQISKQIVDGIPEVSPEQVRATQGKVRLIDVRRADEFVGELGHIAGAELITQGDALNQFLTEGDRNQEIVFVCRSGGRSGTATSQSLNLGYKNTANMVGGMIKWNDLKFPVERS